MTGQRLAAGLALVATYGLAPIAIAAADAVEALPAAPDGTSVREEVVLSGARVGNATLAITRFTDARPADALLDEITAQWSVTNGIPPMRSQQGAWKSVTRIHGRVVETVELLPRALGVEGRRIRISRDASVVQPVTVATEATALIPPGVRAGPPLAQRDGDRETATVVGWSSAPAESLVSAMEERLRARGFVPSALTAAAGASGARALIYQRGRDEVAATVSDHGDRRAVVVHWGSRR